MLVLAGYLLIAARAELSARGVLLGALVVVLTQVVPGTLIWRAVRPRGGWWAEDVAMGFAIGAVLAVLFQIPAGLLHLRWLSAALAALVILVLLVPPSLRSRICSRGTAALPWWWLPSVSATALVLLPPFHAFLRQVPLRWDSGARAPHVDAPLHISLSAQLANRGPLKFPWVESEPLAYHWFSHAWTAQVSNVSGAELDEVIFRLMPAMMPIVIAVGVAIAAVRLSGRAWAGPLAAALTVAGADLNVFGKLTPGYPVAPLSPSLGLAAPMMIGVVVVLAMRWRGQLGRNAASLVPILAIGAAGTKGSTLPLIVAGLGLTVVAMFHFDRSRLKVIAVDLGVMIACLVFALITVFHGSGAGLNLNLSGAAEATPVAAWFGGVDSRASQLFVVALAAGGVFARGIGVVLLLMTRAGRRDPVTWLLLGGGLAGSLAVAVFAHPGSSQYYFARTAGPILALASTIGLVSVVSRRSDDDNRPWILGFIAGPAIALAPIWVFGDLARGDTRQGVAMLLLAAGALAAATLGALVWSRSVHLAAAVAVVAVLTAGLSLMGKVIVEYRAPPYAAPVDVNRVLAISRDQIDAARWLRSNTDVDALVMTNRHCVVPSAPDNCDSRRFVVAAYSERQVLVEGWTPAPKAQEIAPDGRESITVNYWKPELLALNDRFIEAPNATDRDQLWALGVRWVFVDHTRPFAETLEPFATLRYANEGVDVYEFVPPSGEVGE